MSKPMRAGDIQLFRRLARVARPEWQPIAALYAVSVLAMPLALLTPLPLKIAVDSGIGADRPPSWLAALLPGGGAPSQDLVLAVAAALFVAIALLSQLQQLAEAALGALSGERLLLRLRAQLFRHSQRLSLAYHDVRGTADSAYRIQYDAMAIQWIAVTGMAPFVTSALTVIGMIYVTARIDWQLMLVAVAVSPLLVGLTLAYRRRVRPQWREAKALDSSALSVVQEVLTALRVVKAFGQEEQEQRRFVEASARGMRARIRLAVVDGLFGLLIGVSIAAASAAVLYLGARHVQSGAITLGELLLVMGYLTQLYAPLKTISQTAGKLQASLASCERAFALIDEAPDVPERPRARPLRRATGAVVFHRVSFGYGDGREVLRNVSFEVAPRSRVAIVGATGAGKTTLISLLTRFYDPSAGEIRLDGGDLRDYRLADLRSQFAIVLQDPVLFSTTIRENIAYARPGAPEEAIVAAARAAGADDFVAALPDGYDTVLGERGMTLSGGERQRISLARAFLRDAPILILDEPTSAVDGRTETAILESMERLMQGRTAFTISHRDSTLAGCTTSLVIEDGELAVRRRRRRAAPTTEVMK
jgi:ATP-binding cassette, subfamily B, bacterial